ncbi:MAG TPA: hypothetical protein V6D15_23105 [Oculatellaceae cyanobacterium]|jgi:hypothetical protein
MVKTFHQRRHQRLPLASLKLWIAKRPLAFCGGIWIALLLVSTIAAQGLMNPSFVKQQQLKRITAANVEQGASNSISNSTVEHKQSNQISSAVQEENIQTTPSSTNVEVPNSSPALTLAESQPNQAPLWLYGGIFLAFLLGFILIFISFSYKPKRLQTIKSVGKDFKPNQRQTNRKPKKQLPQQQRQQASHQVRKRRVAKPHVLQQPVVTVMPPEPNRAGNSGEESLADIMDLRKHQSLASLLGEKKIS